MAEPPPAVDRKFAQDAVWNYAAFGVMAATGVILNFFIAWKMGVEALGIFNQIYAIYVVAGQLAAFGIHDSAQKHVAQYAGDTAAADLIGRTAFWIGLGIGLVAAVAMFFLSGPIGQITDSAPVAKGVVIIAPAICLFAVNKILMGILNGARRMKAFAVAQSLRMVVILVICIAIGLMGEPAYLLAAGFTIAEIVLCPFLLALTQAGRWPFGAKEAKEWLKRHLDFGMKALSGGFLAESYIRIDILMLAIFVSDAEIGVYSFAAMFVEGLFQIPVVIRTISNPVLVGLLAAGDRTAVVKFVRKVAPLSLAAFLPVALVVLFAFPILTNYYPADLINPARELLFPLFTGLAIYAAFIPFDFALLQSGMPGRQSLLFTLNVLANILLNLAFIPMFGIWGAALATAISFTLSAFTLNLAAGYWLGFRKSLLVDP
jgi:O-antigen/teichoic acid export membrane protein